MNPTEYDAWYDSPRGRWIGQAEYRLMWSGLGCPAAGQLLDVGCGTGWFTRRLAAQSRLQVTGIDLDAESLAFARSQDPVSTYRQADALALPFVDASFDHVVSMAALCFTADWRQAVSEMVRVTRQRFAIGLLNRHSLLWIDKGRLGGSGAYRGALWLSPAEFRQAFSGLSVANLCLQSAVYFPSGRWPARLMEQLIPGGLPLGGFMVVSGSKTVRAGHA
ncbi:MULTISPECIES: class I SAM-dependent methyltransferase [Comamonadaceae]|uniref:Methyltransferase type 11 n=2 Tax=Comamonadaceae TaxID=80864 RepID=F4G9Z7_ALIDK|nr:MULTISPECIES: class I SAM-dependent methyltransferase [Comamonadaceae]ACM33647.1 Methyltransferase type 11 [[Acidovorax] ebreus TPSY]AEB85729.1 Methyltransferase type 11 [Alicycliphilus denitrificans K601]